ncbi:MAG: Mu transposase C-terminal domain-containing protein [Alphaproteobacteria bacterium]|uniref:Mu transposase C-terminal domain-containing protein n=1 Tax=Bradyrhizobium sp. TaxID=376 RepID=UPI001EBA82B3|nr:Mu transposase C-terminal domain-containing protein [Bradyrhizobium sp.]MBV9570789.1 Mu transposase C-terminal domain-containing protein [Alphaproteobacteria bacterium]MBV9979040.1 Mu transposase C-terminal domain-containing protein [Bradyrhizobium sp.]
MSKLANPIPSHNNGQPTEEGQTANGPRFRLMPQTVVQVKGREYVLERRLRNRLCFLGWDGDPLNLTDREIADLQADGCFFVVSEAGEPNQRRAQPVTPLNIGEDAHRENMRRLAYVSACKQHPDYCRSRRVLKPIIDEVAAKRREAAPLEKRPVFSTVISWITLWEKYGDTFGAAALAVRHDLKGWYGTRLAEYQLKAIQAGIAVWLNRTTKKNAFATVLAEVARYEQEGIVDKSTLAPKFLDEEGHLRPPSIREFERRCNGVDPAVRDAMRIGMAYSRRSYRTYTTTRVPERPYQDVEVDDCTLDIVLKHRDGVILGRPNLVVFRDRATGMILGWGFGYDQPSYASFLLGLKSATYGPDTSRFPKVKNKPFWFGRIETLYHDNALHQIGKSIEEASQQLGITLTRLQPRQPWLKGALEGWFRKLGIGIVHRLPGTTLEHVVARRDHENLGEATLYVDQFEALLSEWICDIYNASPTKLNGFIRGFDSGISPLEAFRSKSKDYETDLLPDPELFVALAGQITDRTIQNNGITIDHIIYEGPRLTQIIGNAQHQRKRTHGRSTKCKVARDPHNLGHIFVVDPYTNDRLEIHAVPAHLDYANHLTAIEHEIILRNANAEKKQHEKISLKTLVKKKAELNAFGAKVATGDKFKTVQRKLARYFEGQRLREQRSKIQAFASDGVDYLDAQQPPTVPTVVRAADRSQLHADAQSSDHGRPTSEDEDLDIEEFEARKAWKAI